MVAVDYEGSVRLSILPQMPLDYYGIIARFDTVETAEAAMRRLRQAGTPPGDVRLLGHLSDAVHTGSGLTETDERLVRAVTRDALLGGALGGIVGWIIGMLLGIIPAMDHLLHAQPSWETLVAGGIIGGLVGLIAGALVGGEAGFDKSQAGCNCYDDELSDGVVVVGVHADDGAIGGAVQLLYGSGALSVRRFCTDEEHCL